MDAATFMLTALVLVKGTTGLAAVAAAAPAAITAHPTEIGDVLANPHMGWETFHTPADKDRTLPGWLPSTVYYLRWGWRELEPKPGELNTALIDSALAAAHHAGQRLAFRVMCCSSEPREPYHPDWLKQVGGSVRHTNYDAVKLDVPDLDDATTLDRHLDLVRRIAERYDGHPDLDHVDLGSVGWWGEWHMSGGGPVKMPKPVVCRRIVDTYQRLFRKTPLLMLIGGGEQTGYACAHGAGWRADCLGDLGGFGANWCHMRKGYPQWFREAKLDETWKRAPVAYETCWDMRKWVAEKWSLRYIFNYALDTHASYLNNKSAPWPAGDEVKAEVERFVKRLGYRLVLREVTHPAKVAPGAPLRIASRWQNVGSAPCYRSYEIAWRLKRGDRTVVLRTKAVVSGWMPGQVEVFTPAFIASPPDLPNGPENAVEDALSVPRGLPPGEYELSVAVVDPKTAAPVVRLAIAGRQADGWYPVSKVMVGR